MEAIEDIFNQIQIDADNGITYNKELYLNECKRIVSEKYREQREICATEYFNKTTLISTCEIDMNIIRNAPEPL